MPLGNLPAKASRMWEEVYASSQDRGLSKSASAAQAWCAVKRYYYKKKGRWLRRKKPIAPDKQPPGCTPSRAYRNNPNLEYAADDALVDEFFDDLASVVEVVANPDGLSIGEAQALYRGVKDLGVPGQRDVIYVEEYDEPRSADGVGDVLRFEKNGRPVYLWVYPLPSHDYMVRKVAPPGSSSQDWQMTPLELHQLIDVWWAAQEGRRPYIETLRSGREVRAIKRRVLR